ncbi:hypothetical protein L1887_06528 [Cichorium endivia]|nr:hypothetical protein L1887_06528 [Cichorium endivia]
MAFQSLRYVSEEETVGQWCNESNELLCRRSSRNLDHWITIERWKKGSNIASSMSAATEKNLGCPALGISFSAALGLSFLSPPLAAATAPGYRFLVLGCNRCRFKATEHVAYPVFYDVDPSEVRKQLGPVGEAFARHEKREVGKWKEVLKEAANLAGWDLRNIADG